MVEPSRAIPPELALQGASFDAEYLRVGRLSLLYRTVGSEQVALLGRQQLAAAAWFALETAD